MSNRINDVKPKKILVVEDNEMNRNLVGRRLTKVGFEVVFAGTGIQAIESSVQNLPDLIVMDVNLPGIDGYEAIKRIRANPLTQNIPVIVLTAHASKKDEQISLNSGSNAFETKPVDFKRLFARINELTKK